MGIFKKKTDGLGTGSDIPISQVAAMKAQGYSNTQIIQSLQRDGYTSSQIFDAISQTELAGTSNIPSNIPTIQSNTPPGILDMSQVTPTQELHGSQEAPLGQPVTSSGNMPQFLESSNTEEMIEAIIDEKWNELVKDINKIIEWKQKADLKLSNIEQQMNDLRNQFDKVHQALLGKIGEYDKHIMDVGAELQAMEKVFSKVLPSFVDNINELNRITERMKSIPTTSNTNKDNRRKSGDTGYIKRDE